jgi:hypothetical protein
MFGRGTPAAMSQATWVCHRSRRVNRLAKPPALAALRAGSQLWSEMLDVAEAEGQEGSRLMP